MNYSIRPAIADDLHLIVGLCHQHATHEKVAYNPEGKEALLAEALFSQTPALHCFVVTIGDDIVGYSTFTMDYSTWEATYFLYMDCLYLKPQWRGLGIGKDLMKRINEVARLKKCASVEWQTPPFNLDAIRFYRALGAQPKEKIRFNWAVTR